MFSEMWYVDVWQQTHYTNKEDAIEKIPKTCKKVKKRVQELMDNDSWVVGIDIGKEKLSCALMIIIKELICRFEI